MPAPFADISGRRKVEKVMLLLESMSVVDKAMYAKAMECAELSTNLAGNMYEHHWWNQAENVASSKS